MLMERDGGRLLPNQQIFGRRLPPLIVSANVCRLIIILFETKVESNSDFIGMYKAKV